MAFHAFRGLGVLTISTKKSRGTISTPAATWGNVRQCLSADADGSAARLGRHIGKCCHARVKRQIGKSSAHQH